MYSKLFPGLLKLSAWLPIGFALFLVLSMKKKKTYPNPIPGQPRGVKNNNPGNLKFTRNKWKGKINPTGDLPFEQFTSMEYGARASMKNVITWYGRGYNTLHKLITVWAPPSENDTAAYIAFMVRELSMNADFVFDLTPDLLQRIGYAISIMENGRTKYITPEIYAKAYAML